MRHNDDRAAESNQSSTRRGSQWGKIWRFDAISVVGDEARVGDDQGFWVLAPGESLVIVFISLPGTNLVLCTFLGEIFLSAKTVGKEEILDIQCFKSGPIHRICESFSVLSKYLGIYTPRYLGR